jgi:hypothetical protein
LRNLNELDIIPAMKSIDHDPRPSEAAPEEQSSERQVTHTFSAEIWEKYYMVWAYLASDCRSCSI